MAELVDIDRLVGPNAMEAALRKTGITPDFVAQQLREEMEGEDKFIRQRARQDAAKYLGWCPTQKHEHTGKDGGPIEVKNEMDLGALQRAIEHCSKTK